MGNLTIARIKTLTAPGTYVDGDGLMLVVAPGGSRSWKLRVRINGARRDIGLGSLKVMTLREPRTSRQRSPGARQQNEGHGWMH